MKTIRLAPKPAVTAGGNESRHSLVLFDETPIKLAGFEFHGHGVVPVGRPSIVQWQGALRFAESVERASAYWVGDLLAYAESRQDWKEKMDQALSVSGLARQTLFNLTRIARSVPEANRAIAPSVAHSAVVAHLPEDDQRTWLERAKTEGWGKRELTLELKAAKRHTILEGQAHLEGQYRVLLADPPWLYGDRPPSASGAEAHYSGMTIDALCQLPIVKHARPDAVLFMWVTAPMLLEKPGPREVIEAWGFTPRTGAVWHKRNHNWGHYFSVRHEHVILATRGSCTPDRPTPQIESVFTTSDRDLEHSQKPEELYTIIERLYDGPYLEIFACRPRQGWASYGNDARLIEAAAVSGVPA